MATWLMAANGLCGAMASMARRSTAGLSVSSSPPTGLTPFCLTKSNKRHRHGNHCGNITESD